ncbi:MAG: hypothetical protein LBT71_10485 [Azoarcus sp.]|jgi:hypothetical protein|nr:hypothetical protein [Azoarcus sp.]
MNSSFNFFRRYAGLAALAALLAFSGSACADDFTHPGFKTLNAGLCPTDRNLPADAIEPQRTCSTAKLLYPYYADTPWLFRLLADAVILPMFSEVLGKRVPPLAAGEAVETRYLALLKTLIRESGRNAKDVENPPLFEFSAKLTGCDENNRSPEGNAWPERFGPLLQLSLSHALSFEGEAHPPGPSGGFIVIDTGRRKILTLGDIVLPDREKALEALQRDAFRVYLGAVGTMSDADIEQHLTNPMFAFHLNRNWRIAQGGLVFGYGMYEAGPRSLGMPEIFVARDILQGVLRPGILAFIP